MWQHSFSLEFTIHFESTPSTQPHRPRVDAVPLPCCFMYALYAVWCGYAAGINAVTINMAFSKALNSKGTIKQKVLYVCFAFAVPMLSS